MAPSQLLFLVPLGIGVAWLFYLIFRADLATKGLGQIISYFVGVLIIVLAVGWIVDRFLPSWMNERVQNARTSTEYREFVDTTTGLLESSFSPDGTTTISIPPATTNDTQMGEPIFQDPTPQPSTDPNDIPGNTMGADPQSALGGPTEHIVQPGDTLSSLASRYGTTVEAIKRVNGRLNDFIYVGEVLKIPAPGN